MTVAIGCVSAYDLVLAKGQGGAKIKQIKASRALARSIYQQLGQLSDDETDEDIAKSDQAFPEVVAKGNTPLTDIEATCDALLNDKAEAPAATIT